MIESPDDIAGPEPEGAGEGSPRRKWLVWALRLFLLFLILFTIFMASYMLLGTKQKPPTETKLTTFTSPRPASFSSADELSCAASAEKTTMYRDKSSVIHVVGEVSNDSEMTIAAPEVVVTFLDANGDILGRSRGFGYLFLLAPDEVTPFHVVWKQPEARVADYRISAICSPRQPQLEEAPLTLTVLNAAGTIGEFGYDLRGILTSTQPTQKIRVLVAFYDTAGTVVAVGEYDFLTTDTIEPGDQGDFRIIVPDAEQASQISSFRIQTEGWPVAQ